MGRRAADRPPRTSSVGGQVMGSIERLVGSVVLGAVAGVAVLVVVVVAVAGAALLLGVEVGLPGVFRAWPSTAGTGPALAFVPRGTGMLVVVALVTVAVVAADLRRAGRVGR